MATTGSVSSPGIGSGLDVDGTISKLMAVESQPLTTLALKEASYQQSLSAYGNLSSSLSAFQTAMANLGSASAFQSLKTSVGDSTVLSATANTNAVGGSYQVNVTQLAQAQILSTAGQINSSAAIGSGASTTVSFSFGSVTGGTLTNGTYSGATFAQDASQASGSVTIDSSNNSLQGIRDAI
ncbi:MAG TPA: flagellar cap protein FliD N-terminal domain-containing protein, partial [Herminiimonas sp.]|nr:flagellar cap protein FliD N-terminal domain-containing protein [Herminiimonas sp.]